MNTMYGYLNDFMIDILYGSGKDDYKTFAKNKIAENIKNIDQMTDKGYTMLHIAIINSGCPDMEWLANYLIDSGANIFKQVGIDDNIKQCDLDELNKTVYMSKIGYVPGNNNGISQLVPEYLCGLSIDNPQLLSTTRNIYKKVNEKSYEDKLKDYELVCSDPNYIHRKSIFRSKFVKDDFYCKDYEKIYQQTFRHDLLNNLCDKNNHKYHFVKRSNGYNGVSVSKHLCNHMRYKMIHTSDDFLTPLLLCMKYPSHSNISIFKNLLTKGADVNFSPINQNAISTLLDAPRTSMSGYLYSKPIPPNNDYYMQILCFVLKNNLLEDNCVNNNFVCRYIKNIIDFDHTVLSTLPKKLIYNLSHVIPENMIEGLIDKEFLYGDDIVTLCSEHFNYFKQKKISDEKMKKYDKYKYQILMCLLHDRHYRKLSFSRSHCSHYMQPFKEKYHVRREEFIKQLYKYYGYDCKMYEILKLYGMEHCVNDTYCNYLFGSIIRRVF